jgi:HD-GYP domain-containing protein (c-di-GMP phosphodiesterase class II)
MVKQEILSISKLNEILKQPFDTHKRISDFCNNELHKLIYKGDLLSHSKKVAYYSLVIFLSIRDQFCLSEEDGRNLFLTGLLHDVGKSNIPPEILYKPSKLTFDEFEVMKQHPLMSIQALAGFTELSHIFQNILHHHERYDGKGYPNNLAGINIPLFSRIIAVADSFDAITSTRPYKARLSIDYAMGELLENAGTQFDPDIACRFIDNCRRNDFCFGMEF